MDTSNPKRKPTPASGAGNGQGRKPKWKHTPTTAIRVPESLAAQLLDIATYLDAIPPLDFVQNPEEPKRLESLMVTYESESKGKVREIITLTEGDWKKAEEIADKFYEEIVSHLSERQAKLILTELWEEIL